MALGLFPEAVYTTGHAALEPGDLLVMYSDGMTEAENEAGAVFDEAGLQALVDSREWSTARDLAWASFAAVEQHVASRRLHDDLTVLVVRRLPPLPVTT
jgi:sigma-B regulation protein RsbU (phosphoserine phosphatase)